MLKVLRYDDLGKMDIGWLNAHYHFSFASYLNRDRMGFGPLRVINDDIVQAGSGFDMHEHKDMEIITYVRAGAINHSDNFGNKGRTGAGDVQVMSAGTGIHHAEAADADQETRLYQIWLKPDKSGVTPRWEQGEFPKEPVGDSLNLLVSGFDGDKGKGALFINRQAAIYAGRIKTGDTVTQALPTAQNYILISEGSVKIGDAVLHKGDGAELTETNSVTFFAESDSEVLVISV
jgi:redox-sensitive bicupin YhaK (pirin superfamily)